MADLPPNHIVGNKYNLLKKIAVGGMAEIYLAEQNGPGGFRKRLVIKRILEHLMSDPKFRQMFQDEARLAAGLNHPNIVQIFELGEDDGTYYIAMEYVNGYNLRSLIQSCNEHGMWLAPEYIAKLGSQICEGLEYAHNFCDSDGRHLSIIHRDVSPQNIILSNQGMIKIVDFGIAKASSNQVETQAGVIKGKLAYMSPEQVKGQKLDRRSDIFSLGIVLYELATHKRPFQGKSDLDILRAILEAKPTSLTGLRPDFPQELERIINKALAKNREERYSSSRDLQWDLERFIQNWGKPIGSFQLQQLITKLEEFSEPKEDNEATPPHSQPAAPAPLPQPIVSPAPPVDNYSFDDLDEDTIFNPAGKHGDYNQNPSYAAPPRASYEQPPAQVAPAKKPWEAPAPADEWEDEEGDRTVMNPSPVMSPNDFRHLAQAQRASQSQPVEDLATLHEGSLDINQIKHSIEQYQSTSRQSDGMNNYLRPLPPKLENGPATMLDRSVPSIPPPSYITAPKVTSPRAAQRPVAEQNAHHQPSAPNQANQAAKPNNNKIPLLIIGMLLCLLAGGTLYYLFVLPK